MSAYACRNIFRLYNSNDLWYHKIVFTWSNSQFFRDSTGVSPCQNTHYHLLHPCGHLKPFDLLLGSFQRPSCRFLNPNLNLSQIQPLICVDAPADTGSLESAPLQ